MTNGGQSGMAQTVLGTIRPEELGPTTTHEHLLIDFKVMYHPPTEATELHKSLQPVSLENLAWVRYDQFRSRDNMEVLDEELSISEALLFKGHGGRTIVDATTIGIGRDPRALARIARATGLNVIMGAGYYVAEAHPEGMDAKTAEEIGAQIVAELTTGVGDTGVKAGIIGELGPSTTTSARSLLEAPSPSSRPAPPSSSTPAETPGRPSRSSTCWRRRAPTSAASSWAIWTARSSTTTSCWNWQPEDRTWSTTCGAGRPPTTR